MMKIGLAVWMAASLAFASQEPLSLVRQFKVGETDRYSAKLSFRVTMGDVDVHLKTAQTVKSLLPAGEAEIETKILDLKTYVNGDPMEASRPPDSKSSLSRVSAMGIPLGASEEAGFSFMQFFGLLADRPLEIGKPTEVKWSSTVNAKRSLIGTVTLESYDGKTAKLISHWEIATEKRPKPLKIDMASFVDSKSGKVDQASGTITGVQSDVDVQAIQFSFEREKS